MPHSSIEEIDIVDFIICPADLEENVFKPIYKTITSYVGNILQGAGDSVEAIIFVGELCSSVNLMDLVENICKRVGTRCINAFDRADFDYASFDPTLNGAIMKSIDKAKECDYIPRIELNVNSTSTNSTGDDLHEIFCLIGTFQLASVLFLRSLSSNHISRLHE